MTLKSKNIKLILNCISLGYCKYFYNEFSTNVKLFINNEKNRLDKEHKKYTILICL